MVVGGRHFRPKGDPGTARLPPEAIAKSATGFLPVDDGKFRTPDPIGFDDDVPDVVILSRVPRESLVRPVLYA